MLDNTKAQYFLLCILVIAGFCISGALAGFSAGPFKSPIFYQARNLTLARSNKLPLDPILDVKNFLLSRYPESTTVVGESPDPASDETGKIKARIYDAFVAHDFSALLAIFSRLSFEARPDTVTYSFPGGITRVSYTNFDAYKVIDALDTTVLLTAYLFERLGLRDSARKYYGIYGEALKLILLPGLDGSWAQISRRLSVSRMKLNFILQGDSGPKQYADVSYTDTLIEMFLQQTLARPEFARYRKSKLIYTGAAQRYPNGRFSSVSFDPEPIRAAIAIAAATDKAILVFEYCLAVANDKAESTGLCTMDNIEALFGKKSYAAATLKFKSLAAFIKALPAAYDWQSDADGKDVLVRNDKNESQIKSDTVAFGVKLASLEASLEDRTYNLRDDTLYLSFRFFDLIGQADQARERLCRILSSRAPGSDHVLLATAMLKEKGLVCNGR
jgi:hypothetical protein